LEDPRGTHRKQTTTSVSTSEEERDRSPFPEHNEFPSSLSVLCFSLTFYTASSLTSPWKKIKIGKEKKDGTMIHIYEGNEAPSGFFYLKSC